ncbi:hypothetical protein [Burkholderia ubonensis]|uniref:hypothetical protein n=1 Tax=Burkholderia ubonensis TaxID=101571 RepID=UPI0012BAE665|nr:hypothetical protein [Burkholderia ubonensis]
MNQSGANYDISIWLSYDITTWFLHPHVKARFKCPLPGYLEMSGFKIGLAACFSSV